MRREQRLRRRKDFAAAYRQGQTQGNRLLVVRVRPNGGEATRFGFVAGKVVGGAVTRNLVKRRLRAAARTLATKPGLDIVVGARKVAAVAEYQALERALAVLLKRAGVLADDLQPEGPPGKEHH
ncbi:MAG: ribonuclease P protein component [Chloroflexota bacterium]|nr:ribonuclease P protein component [Chloroflexota bacterium]